ncbi:MAG: hypothetical protein ACRDJU_08545 [Actinomycetota bacterium]
MIVAARWLRDGVRRGHSFSCSNCGLHLSGSFLSYHGRAHPRWQGPFVLPVAMLRVIRHRRGVRVAPYLYLSAGAVGVSTGWVFRKRLRWWSWVPAIAAPAAIGGVSVLSAFTKGRSARTLAALRSAGANALHPGREMQEFYRKEELIFRSAGFPLYGLGPSFRGTRTLRGWEGTDDDVTGLALGHGDPIDPSVPGVEVKVNARSAFLHAGIADRTRLAKELWHRAHPIPLGPPETFMARHWEREHELATRQAPPWMTVLIAVEGDPVEFRWLTEGDHWVAIRDLGDVVVTLWGHGIAPEAIELVKVGNLAPYVTGSRARQAETRERRERGEKAGKKAETTA